MAPRVLIFGAGGVGAGYAYVLLRKLPSNHVVTVCRSNFEVASRDGFIMNSTIFGQNLKFKPTVVRSIDEAITLADEVPFDYVVVTSKVLPKGRPTPDLIRPAISENTAIVLIQNGIGIEDEYVRKFPDNPVISGVVYFAVTQTSPAVLDHSEIELLHIGAYPADAPSKHKDAARSIVSLIKKCGATVKLHDDVQPERWRKLVLNASLNPICALSRLRDTQFIHSGDGAPEFMEDVMNEIVNVAQAYGQTSVSRQATNTSMERIRTRRPPGVEPSMMADALAGRNMEVEAIVGNLVRLAKDKGVQVPLLRTIYMLARALDDSFSRDHRSDSATETEQMAPACTGSDHEDIRLATDPKSEQSCSG